jgi:hypothetical protein
VSQDCLTSLIKADPDTHSVLGGMKKMMLTMMIAVVLTIAGLFALDRLIPWVIRSFASVLPNDIVGPDGWLLDTRDARGVFDYTRSI